MPVEVSQINEQIYYIVLTGDIFVSDLIAHHESIAAIHPVDSPCVVVIDFKPTSSPGALESQEYFNKIAYTYPHTIILNPSPLEWLAFQATCKAYPQVTDNLYKADNLRSALKMAKALLKE